MKTGRSYAPTLVAVLVAAFAGAQEPEPQPEPERAASPAPRRPAPPLQVQVVVSRTRAGRTVSRLPYTVTCYPERPATLRMGVEVPVAIGGDKGTQYRNVGINIDCTGDDLRDGRFKLKLAVEQSSIADLERAAPRPRGTAAGNEAEGGANPVFRTFMSSFITILRDGQNALSTAATDPVTGEEVTIEAGLKVLK